MAAVSRRTGLKILGAGAVGGALAAARPGVASAASAASVSEPGFVYFDDYFAGATVNDKIVAMNAWHKANGATNPRPAVLFDSRVYSFSTPIEMWSGLALLGGRRVAAREFSTGTVLHYSGAAGTSMMTFVANSQGYPGDGSPRDMSFHSIQFEGAAGTHYLPKHDPGTETSYAGKTLWYVNWHGCAWKSFATIWWGWGDGCCITGPTHTQLLTDTAFHVGGSECAFFGNDAFSYADSPTDISVPYFRSRMSKSTIGRVLVTSRKHNTQLSIESGFALDVHQFYVDAQDSDPVYGSPVRISGGDGINLSNLSFKGAMDLPASGNGGAAANRAWIHVTGGSQILVQNCSFSLGGTRATAATPLLYAAPAVGAGQVRWGLNSYAKFGGAAAHVVQSAANQIYVVPDPSVVRDGP
jgi:hypothetical protein